MSQVKLPQFIYWRDGRPRFIPSARERELGFKGEDLREGTNGEWFTFEQAKEWGEARYEKILIARQKGKAQAVDQPKRDRSVERLLLDFLTAMRAGKPGPKGRPLSKNAIDSYAKAIDAIIFKPLDRAAVAAHRHRMKAAALLGLEGDERAREEFAVAPVTSIGKVELNDFYLYAKDKRGHHMGLAMVAAFSAAYTWGGTSPNWRLGANPRHQIKLARPEGRICVYEADEIAAMVAAADALCRWSIGDAILLGLDTGQRQFDRLLLADEGLFDGRRRFRQSKTGVVVQIKETRRLAARLAEAKARTAALKLKHRTRSDTIVLDESTGRPYTSTSYRHVFADVRMLAWRGSNELGLAPCPTLRFVDERDGEEKFKTDQDLRDTCVTRLHRAGCDLLEICDITGHSYASVQTIIKHYLARDVRRADAAIDKLEAWLDREALAV